MGGGSLGSLLFAMVHGESTQTGCYGSISILEEACGGVPSMAAHHILPLGGVSWDVHEWSWAE